MLEDRAQVSKDLACSRQPRLDVVRVVSIALEEVTGPGMYRDAQNQWVVDDSIRLEAGLDADDAIEL